MAATSVILDIRANTTRALSEFKRFSAQLDNKFLISGLKLDVVRNALSQINREFQKAIGEQGLAAGSGLKAAENQAALLTKTFKGFSAESAKAITTDLSKALNQVAVTAGGTMDDVKRTIAATPFISTSLPEEVRKRFGEGLLSFQRDLRRAGISEEFGNVAQQFLSGQTGALELINTGRPLESMLGATIANRAGTVGEIYDPRQRTEILKSIIEDPALQTQLRELALETSGYKIFLEDLNTTLFNPRAGIFGSLREVTMSLGDKTNVFRETNSLVESIFGRQGVFVNFFKQIGKIFGLDDPLKVIISGIRFLTKQFNALNDFLQGETFQRIASVLRDVFTRISGFVTGLFNQVTTDFNDPETIVGKVRGIGESVGRFFGSILDTVKGGEWDPEKINQSIRDVGKNLRAFITQFGARLRGEDITQEADFGSSIIGTLVKEVGSTVVVLFKEIFATLIKKGPVIASALIPTVNRSLNAVLTEAFGPLANVAKIAATVIPGPIGQIARGSIAADVTGGQGLLGTGAVAAAAFAPQIARFARPGIERAGQGIGFLRQLSGAAPAATELGSQGAFHRQVIYYLSRIANCVCGRPGMGVGDTTPGGPRDSRDDRARRGRSRVQGLGYGGPRRAGVTPPLGASFPMDEAIGPRVRPGRFRPRGFGRGALVAGGVAALGLGAASLFGGGSAQAAEIDPMTGEPIQTQQQRGLGAAGQVLGGGFEGAMTGALIGSIVPGVGTAAGAVIGGIIGGVAPLLDKGVRDGVGDFVKGLGDTFSDIGKSISRKFSEGLSVLGDLGGMLRDKIGGALGAVGQALVPGAGLFGPLLEKFNVFDTLKSGVESLSETITGWRRSLPSWVPGSIQGRAAGSNFIGPELAKESRMSGHRSFVANSSEFVIPTNGFSTLANMVAGRISADSAGDTTNSRSMTISPTFNITISGGDIASDPAAFRSAVMSAFQEAWNLASPTIIDRGTSIV